MRQAFSAAFNETHKGLLLHWEYRINLLGQLVIVMLIFVGVIYLMGQGEVKPDQMVSALIGYVVWYYAFIAISDMSQALMEEARTGTLEQMYMSPTSPWILLLGRVFANLVITTLTAAIMVLSMVMIFSLELPLSWAALPVLVVTLSGVFGFGFLIGGATLIYKNVVSIGNLLQNLLVFLNGTLVSVDKFPAWLRLFAESLPTTLGIELLREVTIEGRSLAAVWRDGGLPILCGHSSLYLIVGIAVFKLCERRAKRQGALGQY